MNVTKAKPETKFIRVRVSGKGVVKVNVEAEVFGDWAVNPPLYLDLTDAIRVDGAHPFRVVTHVATGLALGVPRPTNAARKLAKALDARLPQFRSIKQWLRDKIHEQAMEVLKDLRMWP